MSAFLLDDAHIDVLIDAAKQYASCDLATTFCWGDGALDVLHASTPGEPGNETAIGRMLLAENARSVASMYNEAQGPAALFYAYRPTARSFSPGELTKAIACFEYQACGSKTWGESAAFAFCQELKRRLLRSLAPYDEAAPWSYCEDNLLRGVDPADALRAAA